MAGAGTSRALPRAVRADVSGGRPATRPRRLPGREHRRRGGRAPLRRLRDGDAGARRVGRRRRRSGRRGRLPARGAAPEPAAARARTCCASSTPVGLLRGIACLALAPQLPMLADALGGMLDQWRSTPFAGGSAAPLRGSATRACPRSGRRAGGGAGWAAGRTAAQKRAKERIGIARAVLRGAWMPAAASSRQTRPRWPRNGASSASIRASSPRGSPASAQATVFGMW